MKSSESIVLCAIGCVISYLSHYSTVTRHVKAGLIPGHSAEQLEAIQVLEDTAQRLALHMVLAVGDIQFVADSEWSDVKITLALGSWLLTCRFLSSSRIPC